MKSATSEVVYKQLKNEIIYLEIMPGSSISEIETAKKYNVSRTPVRDAFKALENEGLLEIQPHIGTFVSLIDLNKITDVLYMRENLEQSILRDLSASFTNSQYLKLRILLEEQRESIYEEDDSLKLAREFIKSDNHFHQTLYEAANHANIWTFLSGISQQYERFRLFLNLNDKEVLLNLYNQHLQILDTLVHNDMDGLKDIITKHIYDGINGSYEIIHKNSHYFKPMK